MKEFHVGVNDAGQRLDNFIKKVTVSLPQSLLYKYIRLKRIKVNGKRGEISLRLNEGDRVELYINDEFFGGANPQADRPAFLSAPAKLDVLFEDANILLVDKKPGLVVHEDETGSVDTLIARIQHYLFEKGEFDPVKENTFAPALCNRIDRNTGGIVIAAKNAEALRIVNEKLRTREIKKLYLCVVVGRLDQKSGTLTGFLERDLAEKRVYIHEKRQPGDVTVETRYRVLAENGPLSLLEVELMTGRTHQIRAHFASIGHPLLGDGKYGENAVNRSYGMKYQTLYSYKVTFAFKTPAGILDYLGGKTFEAPDVWFAREFYEGLSKR